MTQRVQTFAAEVAQGLLRVRAYGCYGLPRGYYGEQSQFQEYDHYVRIDVETYLQSLAGNSCNS